MRNLRQFFLTTLVLLCSALTSWAEYSGTPSASLTQITASNYTNYGFTADNWQEYKNYYVIGSAEDLYKFAELTNSNKFAKGLLIDDIIINEHVLTNEGKLNNTPTYEWVPMGTQSNMYYGMFDGNGHTISGLYIDNDNDYVGLFGYAAAGDNWNPIKNVGIIDSYIKGGQYVGSICGYIKGRVNITNCYNTGTVIGSSNNVGGICGRNEGWSTITNCYNAGKVTGGSSVGGICSRGQNVANCYNIGTVKGSGNSVGGICGYHNDKPTNCYYLAGCAKDGDDVEQFGIGSFYQGQTITDVGGQTISTTTDEFGNGEIAFKLNGSTSTGTLAWYQTLGEGGDATPILVDNGSNTVYVSSPCHLHYSNTPDETVNHDFENGICKVCNECENIDGVYQLAYADQLYWFAAQVSDGRKDICAVMTADIVVNENVLNADGELIGNGSNFREWTPIGVSTFYYNIPYNGTFDGGGHTISGLYINTNSSFIGLFGYCTSSAEIKNVGVVDSYIKGDQCVGGISGCNGKITNCYNTSTILGSNCEVGGICGSGGTQSYCYNTGIVKGSDHSVGGICGYGGTQTNCYYLAGCAKARNNVEQFGVGNNTYGSSTPDMEGKTESATALEFKSGKVTFKLNGSTSTGTLIWYQDLAENGDALPTLVNNGNNTVYASEPCPGKFSNTPGATGDHNYMDGRCEYCGEYEELTPVNGVYQLANANHLYWFAQLVNNGTTTAKAILTADIKVNENVLTENGSLNGTPARTWAPIGTESNKYTGTFNGQGHTISGLYGNTSSSYMGLFGYCDNYATISNVGIIDSYFKGGNYVGSVCGYNDYGTITNCYNKSTVSGNEYIGGICGYSNHSITDNCYNTGNVSGGCEVGGICGYINYAEIINCYNTGAVKGTSLSNSWAGGICGFSMRSEQSNCYNTGTINGSNQVGGISGGGNGDNQNYCYNTGIVKGSGKNVGGICGDGGVQANYCFYLAGCAKDGSDVEQFGYGNITQGRTTADEERKTISTTANEFASGIVTFKLNGSTSEGNLVWYQSLGEGGDALPTLKNNGNNTVYATEPCPAQFSNTPGTTAEHQFVNGQCKYCGQCVSIDGVYQLANADHLYWFASYVNNGHTDICAALTADIVINENVLTVEGELNGDGSNFRVWVPIGSYTTQYSGTFDGNGHTISGLYYNKSEESGMFGYCTSSAEINNVGVIDSYVKGGQAAGSICGSSYGSITNCYNTGVVCGNKYVGGICGTSYGTITNCYNTGTVTSNQNAGGICGYNLYEGTITNCHNTGVVTASSDFTGGICGENVNATITNCFYLAGCAKDENGVELLGIGGGLSGVTADYPGKTAPATAEEFANGKIGYLLNNGNNTAWHQNLFEDALPVLNATHNSISGYVEVEDNVTTVVGDMILVTDYEIAEGKTLIVPAGTSLTTTGEAVINNNGTLIVNGTIAGNNLAGNGAFITELISKCSIINLNESYVYKGTAYTLEDGLSGVDVITNAEILGKTFTLNATIAPSYINNTNVGTATIKWTDANDANIVLSGQFEITPKEVGLTWNTTLTYNGEEQVATATATELEGEDVCTVIVGGAQINVGTNYTATATGLSNPNYKLPTAVTQEFSIEPKTDVVVTITENSGAVTYNAAEQTVSGYTFAANTELYTEADFTFSGTAEAKGTTVGEYDMNIAASDFSNTNANFANVTFNVVDGKLTINKATTIPNTLTQVGTYAKKIQQGERLLIENWQWAEDKDLEVGNNTVKAEYIGSDAANYVNVIVNVLVIRVVCEHPEDYVSIVNALEPTCIQSGYTGDRKCHYCGEILETGDSLPVTAHKADSVVFENVVEATRTAAGSYDSVVYCSVCKVELSRTTVEVPQISAQTIKLASKPNKVEYKQGEKLDVKGGKITIGYSDKSTEDFEILAGWVSGFDSQKVGEQKLTVTFKSVSSTLTTTFNVTVSKEDDNTAIDEDAANAVNIYAYQNVIVVENAADEIDIYNAMGALVCRDAARHVSTATGLGARTEIRMNTAGIYIVKVGNVAKRVMIND